VDCGAVAPTLVESELFGHARGAFTGADTDRVGAFEAAASGTLFLDEIGELPLALQPKLLRVLERSTIKRLGEAGERAVDARVLAATHRDLKRMVNDGSFREDLYYRLAVFPVTVPALAERREDVAALAQHFFRSAYASAFGVGVGDAAPPDLDGETLALLSQRSWPGNARELRNLIDRVIVLGAPEAVTAGRIADELRRLGAHLHREAGPVTLEEAKRRAERAYLVDLLARHPADRARAAEEAGVHPKSLPRLIRKHGLRPGEADEP
jgi:transcriptional regulator with GAF, ATPase, and Fis domain